MHLTGRYRRPDLGHLAVDLTIEDVKAFTKPYTFTLAPRGSCKSAAGDLVAYSQRRAIMGSMRNARRAGT
jgi:hypothetical protein